MADLQKVIDYIDQHQSELLDLLYRLIELRPVNPGELGIQTWLREYLGGIGFDEVDYWAVDSQKRRPNLVGVVRGARGGRSLIYNGHVDVVPVSEAQRVRWTVDPWKAALKDGMVYGRGSTDMLGGIAAMIWAGKALLYNKVKLGGDLYLECVSGEESSESSLGTDSTFQRGYTAPFAVICEPTNCEIHTATCGTFIFEMMIPGKDVHASMKNLTVYPQRYGIPNGPEVGVDAIGKAVKYLNAFEELEKNWNFRWRRPALGGGGRPLPLDVQGVGIFTITPTLIEGGTYFGSVAGHCNITFQVYFPSWTRAEEVWEEVNEVVRSVSSSDDWLKEHPPVLKVVFPVDAGMSSLDKGSDSIPNWEPNEVPIEHDGCRALASSWEEATRRQAIFSGFKAVCDVTYFGKRGIPAIIFGPGDLSMGAHGPDERVPVKDVIDACKTYAVMAMKWCV